MHAPRERTPAHSPGMLKIPAVHVVEGVHVQVVAGNEADRGDRREASAQEKHSPAATSLAKRRTKPPSNSLSSRSGVHGPASPGPISATPCCRNTSAYARDAGPAETCHTLESRRSYPLPYRGTASSIASTSRFSSLRFG